ncbi:MAG: hypothetical protein H6719_21500 [Sandaracinaceae bacterium]|nr:hypothetical protein [Sandaracinaceae bacterium]
MRFRTSLLFFALSATLPCWGASIAEGQTLDQAESSYRRGRFLRASREVDAALEAEALTRDDLVALMELRARVALALGDEERMRAAAVALAALDPQRELSVAIRPELRAAFEAARDEGGALAVVVDVERTATGATLTARAEHDPAELVRGLRVEARVGEGEWQSGEPTLELEVVDTEDLAYHAVAVGPGGARLAELGSAEAPQISAGRAPAPPIVVEAAPVVEPPSDDPFDLPLVVGLAVGGAVLIGVVIAIVAVVASSSGAPDDQRETAVGPPTIVVWSMP